MQNEFDEFMAEMALNGISQEQVASGMRVLMEINERPDVTIPMDFTRSTMALFIKHIEDFESRGERQKFINLITSFWKDTTRDLRKINKHKKARKRARITYDLIQPLIDNSKTLNEDHNISCRKGCGHCCRIRVGVTPDEGELLAGLAKDRDINLDHFAKQLKCDHPSDWYHLKEEEARCVFLDNDNTCSIYEDRPMACRTYHVISEPDLCNAQKYNSAKITGVCDLFVELVWSAASSMALDAAESRADALDALPRQINKHLKLIKEEGAYAYYNNNEINKNDRQPSHPS